MEKIGVERLGAVKNNSIENYLELLRKTEDTIRFLKSTFGSELNYNDYKEAIIRLEGFNRGLKMSDWHHDQIAHERLSTKLESEFG